MERTEIMYQYYVFMNKVYYFRSRQIKSQTHIIQIKDSAESHARHPLKIQKPTEDEMITLIPVPMKKPLTSLTRQMKTRHNGMKGQSDGA